MQITLSDEEYARLKRESERTGVALAELVRRALHQTHGTADAVEAGEEVVILRRDRPVARLVPIETPAPFLDRSALREEVPPMRQPVEQVVRALREEERY